MNLGFDFCKSPLGYHPPLLQMDLSQVHRNEPAKIMKVNLEPNYMEKKMILAGMQPR